MTATQPIRAVIEEALKAIHSSSAVIGMLPESPGYNGCVLLIDDTEAKRIVKDLDEAAEIINAAFQTSLQQDPCKGKNCESTVPNLHSAECFAEYEAAIGFADHDAQVKVLSDELVRMREALELWHEHMRLYLPHYASKHDVFDADVKALSPATPKD